MLYVSAKWLFVQSENKFDTVRDVFVSDAKFK